MADAAATAKKPKAEKKAKAPAAAEDKPALKKRPFKRHGRLYAKAIFTGLGKLCVVISLILRISLKVTSVVYAINMKTLRC